MQYFTLRSCYDIHFLIKTISTVLQLSDTSMADTISLPSYCISPFRLAYRAMTKELFKQRDLPFFLKKKKKKVCRTFYFLPNLKLLLEKSHKLMGPN